MDVADERLKQLYRTSLTKNERVLLRCCVAADQMHKGQYEAARETLGELWPGVGHTPDVENLPPAAAAEVLLQCGVLTGWLGRIRGVEGAQEKAQDLIKEALRDFQSQGRLDKVSEAQCELAVCYWRAGAYDEARVMLLDALRQLKPADVELKARLLIRRTLVEVSENRYHNALSILMESEPVFESAGDALRGRWHGQRAVVLLKLATTEERPDYADRAVMEFTAAIHHYERAGSERYCGISLNDLAFLLYKLGRYRDAHEHLDRAQLIFTKMKDAGLLAQVDGTRARVLTAEKSYRDAERIIAGVIKTFEEGGQSALLADALTVQGVVWARLGAFDSSMNALRRAVRLAQDSGAFTNAGLAAVTLIEEHGATRRLSDSELSEVYQHADQLLKGTQDAEDKKRLLACARIVLKRLTGTQLHDKNFSFYGAVHELEARLIGQALELEGGSISRAARRLGLKHQALSQMLRARHKRLMSKRTPPTPRRRSIIKDRTEP